jgi:hypothetical protein
MRFYRVTREWDDEPAPIAAATLTEAQKWVRDSPILSRDEVLIELIELPKVDKRTVVTLYCGGKPKGMRVLRAWRGTLRGGLRELDPRTSTNPRNRDGQPPEPHAPAGRPARAETGRNQGRAP